MIRIRKGNREIWKIVSDSPTPARFARSSVDTGARPAWPCLRSNEAGKSSAFELVRQSAWYKEHPSRLVLYRRHQRKKKEKGIIISPLGFPLPPFNSPQSSNTSSSSLSPSHPSLSSSSSLPPSRPAVSSTSPSASTSHRRSCPPWWRGGVGGGRGGRLSLWWLHGDGGGRR